MIPEADMVAFSGSVSNHWSRKSAALIVITWMKVSRRRRGSSAKLRASGPSEIHSAGWMRPWSGGTTDRIGLMKRAMCTIRRPYSSYASASDSDQRRSSRNVVPWSFTRHR
jgi:hypothetical protein